MLVSLSKRTKKHYCNADHYWKASQGWQSTYTYRNLEGTPKQKLVRFLVSHGVGQSGYPGEHVITLAKSGFYINETFSNASSLNGLGDELFKLGHYLLSRCIQDGTWLDEDTWPCYSQNWYHRPRTVLPWENREDERMDW
jgi:hypothetical protein